MDVVRLSSFSVEGTKAFASTRMLGFFTDCIRSVRTISSSTLLGTMISSVTIPGRFVRQEADVSLQQKMNVFRIYLTGPYIVGSNLTLVPPTPRYNIIIFIKKQKEMNKNLRATITKRACLSTYCTSTTFHLEVVHSITRLFHDVARFFFHDFNSSNALIQSHLILRNSWEIHPFSLFYVVP